MTSTSAGQATYRPEVEVDGVSTRVLIDQIFSIDPGRLGEVRGSLDAASWRSWTGHCC
jgi:mRNA interferase MazF